MTVFRLSQVLIVLVNLLDNTCCDTNYFLPQGKLIWSSSSASQNQTKTGTYYRGIAASRGGSVVRSNVPPNLTINDPLFEACKNTGREDINIIRCYLCQSSTKKDKEPKCDTKLWKYLKHSEKTRLKSVCDAKAKFCYKMLVLRLGERVTKRGCVGDQIEFAGTKVDLRKGCVKTKSKDGYRTTVCLCDSDYCNKGGGNGTSKFLGMVLILAVWYL